MAVESADESQIVESRRMLCSVRDNAEDDGRLHIALSIVHHVGRDWELHVVEPVSVGIGDR